MNTTAHKTNKLRDNVGTSKIRINVICNKNTPSMYWKRNVLWKIIRIYGKLNHLPNILTDRK